MPVTRRRESEISPTKEKKPRRRRSRPTPRWLAEQPDLDELARSRCLLILSVLSGERPVSEVIEQAQLSRQRYYDLETRALNAMLRALAPGGGAESGAAASPERRISELEQQVKQLETEKRRAERLLLLTRKVMRTGRGTKPTRTKKKRPSSTTRGSKRSSVSKTRASTPTEPPSSTTPSAAFPASIPTPDGEIAH